MTPANDKNRIEIFIPNWHPTPLNKLLSNHWAVAARMKKADYAMVSAYTHHLSKAIKKRVLTLIVSYQKGKKFHDPDSFLKSMCDALVRAGQLVNDSPKWVEINPVIFTRGNMSTTIILEDI